MCDGSFLFFSQILKIQSRLPAVEIQQPKTTTKRRRTTSSRPRVVQSPSPSLLPALLDESNYIDEHRRSPCPSVTDSEYSASSSSSGSSTDHYSRTQAQAEAEGPFQHVFDSDDEGAGSIPGEYLAEHLLDEELAAWVGLLG